MQGNDVASTVGQTALMDLFHCKIESAAVLFGEGNGNPLQYPCLENPRDGEPGGLPSMGSHRVGYD